MLLPTSIEQRPSNTLTWWRMDCAGAEYALPAGPPKRRVQIDLGVDLDHGTEAHLPRVIAIYVEREPTLPQNAPNLGRPQCLACVASFQPRDLRRRSLLHVNRAEWS